MPSALPGGKSQCLPEILCRCQLFLALRTINEMLFKARGLFRGKFPHLVAGNDVVRLNIRVIHNTFTIHLPGHTWKVTANTELSQFPPGYLLKLSSYSSLNRSRARYSTLLK